MDYDKVSMFYAGPTTVTQTHCLAPLRLPNIAPLQQTSAETVQTNKFLEPTQTPPSSSSSSSSSPSASLSIAPNADPFTAYADNFDLSLLPQECTTPTEHIPTSVYHYTSTTSSTPNLLRHVRMEAATAHTPQTPHAPQTPLTPQTPQIKIEQAWSFGSALSLPEEIKREPLTLSLQSSQSPTLLKSPNQLVPPPPYPNIYPSPQSSPAQSEYAFPHSLSQFGSCYDSVSSSRSSLHPSSPFAPFDASNIKQELHILPPSPPESNCEASSPHSTWTDIKSEPIDADVETLIDLNALLDKKSFNTSYKNTNKNSDSPNETSEQLMSPTALAQQQHQNQQQQQQQHQQQAHDHQLLREFLEDCICPMSCSMDEVNGNIEKVISMALEDTKSQAVEICAKLQISQDPSDWSTAQVHAWLRSTVAQFKLPEIADLELNFPEDGAAFILLSEEDFKQRAPQSGSDLYAQLEVWRYHFNSNAPESDDEDDMLPTTSATLCAAAADGAGNSVGAAPATKRNTGASVELKQRSGRNGGSHIHLWQFLKELLGDPHVHGTAIRWIDRNRGVFKIEDSVRVAKLWGGRKNRPAMNYDKLSRSIRQYYKKGIMKKTERSQRLVYQFCHPYQL